MSQADDKQRTLEGQVARIRNRIRTVQDPATRAVLSAILDLILDGLK